jgi:hypothetical protein
MSEWIRSISDGCGMERNDVAAKLVHKCIEMSPSLAAKGGAIP